MNVFILRSILCFVCSFSFCQNTILSYSHCTQQCTKLPWIFYAATKNEWNVMVKTISSRLHENQTKAMTNSGVSFHLRGQYMLMTHMVCSHLWYHLLHRTSSYYKLINAVLICSCVGNISSHRPLSVHIMLGNLVAHIFFCLIHFKAH